MTTKELLELTEKVGRIDERTIATHERVEAMHEDLRDMRNRHDEKFVTKKEFESVKLPVFGGLALIVSYITKKVLDWF